MNEIVWDIHALKYRYTIKDIFAHLPALFDHARQNDAEFLNILYTLARCHVYFPHLVDANLAAQIETYCLLDGKNPILYSQLINKFVNENEISRKNELERLRYTTLRSCKVDRKVDMQTQKQRLLKSRCSIECRAGGYDVGIGSLKHNFIFGIGNEFCDIL